MPEEHIANLCSPWIQSKNTIWEQVLHLGRKCTYNKGNIVAGNGDEIDCLYYLYKGRLKMSKINSAGTEKILWYLDEGNLFGEVPFLDKKPMDSTFTANTPCEVYIFTRQCVQEEIIVKYPALVLNLLESLANKARVFSTQASDIATLIGRVSKVLIYVIEREYVDKTTGRIECSRGISQQELASILGVHRVTLNHAISQLKKNGIVEEMTKKRLIISDYSQLLSYAAVN